MLAKAAKWLVVIPRLPDVSRIVTHVAALRSCRGVLKGFLWDFGAFIRCEYRDACYLQYFLHASIVQQASRPDQGMSDSFDFKNKTVLVTGRKRVIDLELPASRSPRVRT